MKKAIELNGVSRTYRQGGADLTVLQNINLQINAGEMVAITGPSGAGKSTLMNIIGCLDQSSEGECRILGKSTTRLTSDELAQLRREHIGFIFQRYHLISELDALSNVELPAVYSRGGRLDRRQRASSLLVQLGLGGRERHRPDQLSGGQQQRVCIARALMNGGDIILADEPTGALDSATSAEMLDILRDLHQKGHTIIIVTHDMQVARLAQRVIELRDGIIVADSGEQSVVDQKAFNPVPPSSYWLRLLGRAREAMNMAFHAVNARRLRTALTLSGMVFGIAAVVTVVAAGEGAQQQTLQQLRSLSPRMVQIASNGGFGANAGTYPLTTMDVSALSRLPGVAGVSPLLYSSGEMRFRQKSSKAIIQGVGREYFRINGVPLVEGNTFFNDSTASQSVIIDEYTRQALFGANDLHVIGQVVFVGNVPLRIVGVVQNSGYQRPGDVTVWLPWSTVLVRFTGNRPIDSIVIRLKTSTDNESVVRAISNLLTQRHGGHRDFFVQNNDRIRHHIERTNMIFNLLILSVAGVALGIGCLGVMNIMLVTVTERTREIGVRIAVGARRSDIMWQFMAEALLVCITGGVLGLILSASIGPLFSTLAAGRLTLIFSWQSAVLAFLCALLTGMVFGYLPARRAARLNPITALAGE